MMRDFRMELVKYAQKADEKRRRIGEYCNPAAPKCRFERWIQAIQAGVSDTSIKRAYPQMDDDTLRVLHKVVDGTLTDLRVHASSPSDPARRNINRSRRLAWEMRQTGMTFVEIAEKLGISERRAGAYSHDWERIRALRNQMSDEED